MDDTENTKLIPRFTYTLDWVDYLLFSLFLLASIGIGIYYGIQDLRKKANAQEFLLGGKDMKVLPVSVAILSSMVSAVMVLGTPAEIYTHGVEYWWLAAGMVLGCLMARALFVPLLYSLKITSANEYLEKRFMSKYAKLTGTVILLTMQILYTGVALFSPSIALEAVTGFPVWVTIVIGGVVAMIYTALGGMKASVWASAFQTLILFAGVIGVIIKGCIDVGGIDKMWELNEQGGRINFFDFSPDPTHKHTFWTLIIGNCFDVASRIGVNQASVQRYVAMSTQREANMVVLLNAGGMLLMVSACVLAGMAVFAYYASVGCDPLKAGYIDTPNQLMPYFVMDRMGYPGVPGLFMACLFSGSLSSVSASLAALSAVTWKDILSPIKPFNTFGDGAQMIVVKSLVIFYGGLGIIMAFVVGQLGGTVMQLTISFAGAAGGPLLGLFILGSFFPCANAAGAVVGGVIGLALPLWLTGSSFQLNAQETPLNTTVMYCLNATISHSTAVTPDDIVGFDRIYLISYCWYAAIGASTCIIVGLLVTACTGCTDPSTVPSEYILHIFDKFCCCLPNSTLQFLRCDVGQLKDDDTTMEMQEIPSGRDAPPAYNDIPMDTRSVDNLIYSEKL